MIIPTPIIPKPTVTITQEEYDHLVDDSEFLGCLRGAGVDNWDGYDYAQSEYLAAHDKDEE